MPNILSVSFISLVKVSIQRPQLKNSRSVSGTHPKTSQGCPRKRVSGVSISSRPELGGKSTESFVGRFASFAILEDPLAPLLLLGLFLGFFCI
jgi:hypothetical protein